MIEDRSEVRSDADFGPLAKPLEARDRSFSVGGDGGPATRRHCQIGPRRRAAAAARHSASSWSAVVPPRHWPVGMALRSIWVRLPMTTLPWTSTLLRGDWF